MEVTAADVKKLREKTGAGMLDCKKALSEANGDFAHAEKLLKELGLAAAANRSGRATHEGRIFSRVEKSIAGLLELSCETDFVAINQEFIAFGENLLKEIIEKRLVAANDELAGKVAEIIGRIKENITIRRFRTIPIAANELAVDYIHGEGSHGVLVKLRAEKPEVLAVEAVKSFAFDCALHIAAFHPLYLSKETVDATYLKEQEEIFTKQTEAINKPANILAGIVKGKINKHLSEICFLQQPFVKDDKQTVLQVLERTSKEAGSKIEIVDFLYFRTGEEIAR